MTDPHPHAGALADLLYAEAAVFTELADLAVQQRQALLRGDEARIETLAARAATLATRFRLLEDERVRVEPAGGVVPGTETAREALVAALGRLLRETAVSRTVLERLGDTVSARLAAVGGLFGNTYLPSGRTLPTRPAGRSLCAEG